MAMAGTARQPASYGSSPTLPAPTLPPGPVTGARTRRDSDSREILHFKYLRAADNEEGFSVVRPTNGLLRSSGARPDGGKTQLN